MSYTLVALDNPSNVMTGAASSLACWPRPLGGSARVAWDGLWREGSTRDNDPSGLEVLRYGRDASPPLPSLALEPVRVRRAVSVACATLNTGTLAARDASGVLTTDVAAATSRVAVVRTSGGAVDVRTVDVWPSPVTRAAVAFGASTLAGAGVGAIVAAPDGTQIAGDDVWRLWRVVDDGAAVSVPGLVAPLPASTVAARFSDTDDAWSARVRAELGAGRAATVVVCAVTGNGSLLFAEQPGRSAADAVARASSVSTLGALGRTGALAAYSSTSAPATVGASWSLVLL